MDLEIYHPSVLTFFKSIQNDRSYHFGKCNIFITYGTGWLAEKAQPQQARVLGYKDQIISKL